VALSTGSSLTSQSWGSWSPAVSWTDIVVGDFNGDHRQDVAGLDPTTGIWQVALSTGTRFINQSWVGNWSAGWIFVRTGDFNGDGRTDIAGWDSVSGYWKVSLSTGNGFVTQVWG